MKSATKKTTKKSSPHLVIVKLTLGKQWVQFETGAGRLTAWMTTWDMEDRAVPVAAMEQRKAELLAAGWSEAA